MFENLHNLINSNFVYGIQCCIVLLNVDLELERRTLELTPPLRSNSLLIKLPSNSLYPDFYWDLHQITHAHTYQWSKNILQCWRNYPCALVLPTEQVSYPKGYKRKTLPCNNIIRSLEHSLWSPVLQGLGMFDWWRLAGLYLIPSLFVFSVLDVAVSPAGIPPPVSEKWCREHSSRTPTLQVRPKKKTKLGSGLQRE